jgi:hypothetical protein
MVDRTHVLDLRLLPPSLYARAECPAVRWHRLLL